MKFEINPNGIWYHGSNKVFDTLREGSTITQWVEMAEAFSHRPTGLGYDDDGQIIHNGTEKGYLYVIDESIEIGEDIYQHPRTSMDENVEFLTKRELRVRLIREVMVEKIVSRKDMKTERCILGMLKYWDYEDVRELYMNSQVREFLGGIVSEQKYSECFRAIVDGKDNGLYWGIRLRETNEFIGLVSVDTHHDGISKELSYQFLPSYWGNGYALEVTEEILNYAFNTLNIRTIIAETQSVNTASCKLLNKLGMKIIDKVQRFGADQYVFGINSSEFGRSIIKQLN